MAGPVLLGLSHPILLGALGGFAVATAIIKREAILEFVEDIAYKVVDAAEKRKARQKAQMVSINYGSSYKALEWDRDQDETADPTANTSAIAGDDILEWVSSSQNMRHRHSYDPETSDGPSTPSESDAEEGDSAGSRTAAANSISSLSIISPSELD
ncbi:unnamed protein product [Kuraishia capsulata CBS 1993]|uniref:Uncharacterized protein n=1 Tax=Kuraishia capsulata CBS 1993 TaxID=1382522 RepID=W6MFE2_9ASCO|nr:uncharacterized protein KUCA_T00000236001 [Kuraishia capsulata CBS 1993]CDK24276.1 unnamed protein product [Kuraishia capsulata CBS 1993]